MARKSDGEKIDELEKLVAALQERLDNVREQMIDRVRVGVIEERLNELKKTIEESGRRQWLLVPAIIGGIVGAVLAFLAQLALAYLKK